MAQGTSWTPELWHRILYIAHLRKLSSFPVFVLSLSNQPLTFSEPNVFTILNLIEIKFQTWLFPNFVVSSTLLWVKRPSWVLCSVIVYFPSSKWHLCISYLMQPISQVYVLDSSHIPPLLFQTEENIIFYSLSYISSQGLSTFTQKNKSTTLDRVSSK